MASYIIHKAVNADAVKKKLQRSLEDYGTAYLAQPKFDGCCAVMFLDPSGATKTLSRTGELVRSMAHVEELYAELFQEAVHANNGLVLIGEAWWPGKDQFSIISGDFRRHSNSPNLGMIINDVLTAAEFEIGHSPVPYIDRYVRLMACPDAEDYLTAIFTPGSYGCPQEKCNEYVNLGGFDGLILRDPKGTWTVGSGTTGELVKIKRVLSFDLEVTGIGRGLGKHKDRTGYLVINYGGKTLKVGTGFSDVERDLWWDAPSMIVGKIVEVEAMDYSSEGLLREPRFKGVRFDKLEPDTIAA